jgi:hypothetical protein
MKGSKQGHNAACFTPGQSWSHFWSSSHQNMSRRLECAHIRTKQCPCLPRESGASTPALHSP